MSQKLLPIFASSIIKTLTHKNFDVLEYLQNSYFLIFEDKTVCARHCSETDGFNYVFPENCMLNMRVSPDMALIALSQHTNIVTMRNVMANEKKAILFTIKEPENFVDKIYQKTENNFEKFAYTRKNTDEIVTLSTDGQEFYWSAFSFFSDIHNLYDDWPQFSIKANRDDFDLIPSLVGKNMTEIEAKILDWQKIINEEKEKYNQKVKIIEKEMQENLQQKRMQLFY